MVVYDGSTARIRTLRSKGQGWRTVAKRDVTKGVLGLWPTPDWRLAEPERASASEAYTSLLCAVMSYSVLILSKII